jgi:phage anti-repressor protein
MSNVSEIQKPSFLRERGLTNYIKFIDGYLIRGLKRIDKMHFKKDVKTALKFFTKVMVVSYVMDMKMLHDRKPQPYSMVSVKEIKMITNFSHNEEIIEIREETNEETTIEAPVEKVAIDETKTNLNTETKIIEGKIDNDECPITVGGEGNCWTSLPLIKPIIDDQYQSGMPLMGMNSILSFDYEEDECEDAEPMKLGELIDQLDAGIKMMHENGNKIAWNFVVKRKMYQLYEIEKNKYHLETFRYGSEKEDTPDEDELDNALEILETLNNIYNDWCDQESDDEESDDESVNSDDSSNGSDFENTNEEFPIVECNFRGVQECKNLILDAKIAQLPAIAIVDKYTNEITIKVPQQTQIELPILHEENGLVSLTSDNYEQSLNMLQPSEILNNLNKYNFEQEKFDIRDLIYKLRDGLLFARQTMKRKGFELLLERQTFAIIKSEWDGIDYEIIEHENPEFDLKNEGLYDIESILYMLVDIYCQHYGTIRPTNEEIFGVFVEKVKVNKNYNNLKEPMVGFDPKNTVKSKNDQEIQDAMGDIHTGKYKEIADNHDLRVVRNTFATIEKQIIISCKPSKELVDHFSGLTNFSIQMARNTCNDPNIEFNLDVATMVAYSMVNPERYDACKQVSERLSLQPDVLIGNSNAADIHICMNFDEDCLLKYQLIYVICPITNNKYNGKLPLDIGDYTYTANSTVWVGKQTTQVSRTLNINAILQGDSKTIIGKTGVFCVARHNVGAFQILGLTACEHKTWHTISNHYSTFEIPIVKKWLLSEIGIPSISFETVQLNRELLNRLINRNLTLKVSDDAMVEYAMALSWYSYNKRGVELSNIKVTPEMAMSHIYVAKVLLLRQKLHNEILTEIMTEGSMSRMCFAILSATFAMSMEKLDISEGVTKIVEFITQNMQTPTIRNNLDQILESWDSIDVWLQTPGNTNTKDIKLGCLHHIACSRKYTAVVCKCCGFKTAKDGDYCDCCANSEIGCPHVCDGIHDFGGLNCNCCGKKSKEITCDCCLLHDDIKFVTPEESSSRNKQQEYNLKDEEIKEKSKSNRIDAISNSFKNVGMSWGHHGHECPKCHQFYTHTHKNPSDDSTNPKHQIHVGACPWCEQNKESVKIVKRNEATLNLKHTENQLDVELLGKRHYLEQLTPNTVEYLMSEANTNPKEIMVANPLKPKFSTLPFLGQDRRASDFIVTEHQDVTTFDCGYDSLKHYIGITLSEKAVELAIKKLENFSDKDLIKVARKYSINLVVLLGTNAFINRSTKDDEFACIIHSTVIHGLATKMDHWYVGKIAYSESAKVVPYGSTMNAPKVHEELCKRIYSCNYEKLSNAQKLNVSFTLANRFSGLVASTFEPPSFVNNKLFNGAENNSYGAYNFDTHSALSEILHAFTVGMNNRMIPEIIGEAWNCDYDESFNIVEQAKNSARSTCFSILSAIVEPSRYCIAVNCKVIQAHKNKNKYYIDVSETNTKTGDMILVADGANVKPLFVRVEESMIEFKPNHVVEDSTIKIFVPKSSFISGIYNIKSCSNAIEHGGKKLLLSVKNEKSLIINGLAGTGKTTFAADYIKTNCINSKNIVCIACTRTAKQAMLAKINFKNTRVLTYEAASRSVLGKCDLLVIDEATMLQPWQIAGLLTEETQLIIMGDTNQVGSEDFSNLAGDRIKINLLEWAEKECAITNKVDMHKTYRFGNPLTFELAQHPALKKLESGTEKETNIKLGWLSKGSGTDISRFFAGCNVILCYYNQHVEDLKKIMSNTTITISTIAKYQGLENAIVGVYQSPLMGKTRASTATTHLNYKHGVSAATRAITELRWLSVGCFSKDAPLYERLGVIVAGVSGTILNTFKSHNTGWDYHEMKKNSLVIVHYNEPIEEKFKRRKGVDIKNNQEELESMKKKLGISINGSKGSAPLPEIPSHCRTKVALMLGPKPWYTKDTEEEPWIDHIGLGVVYTIGDEELLFFLNYNFFGLTAQLYTCNFSKLEPETYTIISKPLTNKLIKSINECFGNTHDYLFIPKPMGTIYCWAIISTCKKAGLIENDYYLDSHKKKNIVEYRNVDNEIYVNTNQDRHRQIGNELYTRLLCDQPFINEQFVHPKNQFLPKISVIDIKMLHKLINKVTGGKCQIKRENDIFLEIQLEYNQGIHKFKVHNENNILKFSVAGDMHICRLLIICTGLLSFEVPFKLNKGKHVEKLTTIDNLTLNDLEVEAIKRAQSHEKIEGDVNMLKLDIVGLKKFVENEGKDMDLHVDFKFSKESLTANISVKYGFLRFNKYIVCDLKGKLINHNLPEQSMAFDLLNAAKHFCYLEENKYSNHIEYKLNKKGATRTRILSFYAKVYEANNEKFIIDDEQSEQIEIKNDETGCAACCAVKFIDKEGNVLAIITSDYLANNARTVIGEKAEEVSNLMNTPGICKLMPIGSDDKEYSKAILTERINAFIQEKKKSLESFSKFMRQSRHKNIQIRAEIRNTLGTEIKINEYDDMSIYPFWKTSKSSISKRLLTGTNSKEQINVSYVSENERKIVNILVDKNQIILEALVELTLTQQNHRISSLIAKKYIDEVGAADRLPGMMESYSWHKNNQTLTAHELVNKTTMVNVKALKYEEKIVYVPDGVYSYCNDILGEKAIGNNFQPNVGDIVCQAIDIIALRCINGQKPYEYIVASTPTTYSDFAIDLERINITEQYCTTEDKVLATQINPIRSKMIKNRLKREPHDTDYFNAASKKFNDDYCKAHDNESISYFTASLLEDVSTFLEIVKDKSNDNIYITCPSELQQFRGNWNGKYRDSNRVFTIDEEIVKMIQNGKEIVINDKRKRLHVIRTWNGALLLKIGSEDWMEPTQNNNKFLIMDIPILITKPSEVLKVGDFSKTRKYAINISFAQNLLRRAMRPGTTLNDLYVQARTLVNVGQFSTTTVASKYKVEVADASIMANIAYLTMKEINDKYSYLHVNENENIVMHSIKRASSLVLGKAVSAFTGDLNIDNLLLVMEKFMPKNTLRDWTMKLFSTFKKLKMHCLSDSRIFVEKEITVKSISNRVGVFLNDIRYDDLSYKDFTKSYITYVDPNCDNCNSDEFMNVLFELGVNFTNDIQNKNNQIMTHQCNHEGGIILGDNNIINKNLEQNKISYGFPSDINAPNSLILPNINLTLEGVFYTSEDLNSLTQHEQFTTVKLVNSVLLIDELFLEERMALSVCEKSTIVVRNPQVKFKINDKDNDIFYLDENEEISVSEIIDALNQNKLYELLYLKCTNSAIKPIDLAVCVHSLSTQISGFKTNGRLHFNLIEEERSVECEFLESLKKYDHNNKMSLEPVVVQELIKSTHTNNTRNRHIASHLMGMAWGTNVDLTSTEPHFIEHRVLEGMAINKVEMNVLESFNYMIHKLFMEGVITTEADIVTNDKFIEQVIHIYTFDTGMNRSIAHDLPGIHVILTTLDNYNKFDRQPLANYIVFNVDKFERFGACLRVIFGCLMPECLGVQFHEARPFWQTYFYEKIAYKLFFENDGEGVICSWLGTPASTLGHTVWGRRNNSASIAKILRTCIQFGDVYGTDEVLFKEWPVSTIYYNQHSTLPYSNFYIVLTNMFTVKEYDDSAVVFGLTHKDVSDLTTICGMTVIWQLSEMIDKLWTKGGRIENFDKEKVDKLINNEAKKYIDIMRANSEQFYDIPFDPTPHILFDCDSSRQTLITMEKDEEELNEDDLLRKPKKGKEKKKKRKQKTYEEMLNTQENNESSSDEYDSESEISYVTKSNDSLKEREEYVDYLRGLQDDYDGRDSQSSRSPSQLADNAGEPEEDVMGLTRLTAKGLDILSCFTDEVEYYKATEQAMEKWVKGEPAEITYNDEIINFNKPTKIKIAKSKVINFFQQFNGNTNMEALWLVINELANTDVEVQIEKRQTKLAQDTFINNMLEDFKTMSKISIQHKVIKKETIEDQISAVASEGLRPFITENCRTGLAENCELVYNPLVSEACGREVLKHIMSYNGYTTKFDMNYHIKEFENIERIRAVLVYHGISHVTIMPDGLEKWHCLNSKTFEVLKVVDGGVDDSWHVVYYGRLSLVNEQIEQLQNFEKRLKTSDSANCISVLVTEIDKTSKYINKFEEYLNELDTLAIVEISSEKIKEKLMQVIIRLQGAYGIVSSKAGLPIETCCAYGINTVQLHNVYSDKVYLFRSTTGLKAKITYKDDCGNVYCRKDLSVDFSYAIDIGCNLGERQVVIKNKVKHGFVNLESRKIAKHAQLAISVYPVFPEAEELYVLFYDGCNHHNRPDRNMITNKILEGKEIHTLLSTEYMEIFKRFCVAQGPIQIGIAKNNLTINAVANDKRKNCLIQELLSMLNTENDLKQGLIAIEHSSYWGWKESGNRWIPKNDEVIDELIVEKGHLLLTLSVLVEDDNQSVIFIREMLEKYNLSEDRTYSIKQIKDSIDWHCPEVNSNCVGFQPKNNRFSIYGHFSEYEIGITGKGIDVNDIEIMNTVDDLKDVVGDHIFGKKDFHKRIQDAEKNGETEIDPEMLNNIKSIDVLNNVAITDWQAYPDIGLGDNQRVKILVGNGNYDCPINVEVADDVLSPNIINYWNDETAMVDNEVPLPRNNINLRGGEIPTGLKDIEKQTLVEYPSHAQPNYTMRSGAGLQAISALFGTKLNVREVVHDPTIDADKFVQTYCSKGSLTGLPQVNVDYQAIIDWLKERPDKTKIAKEVDDILAEGLDINGLDKVNVHLKLEARMKDVMLNAISEIGMPETIADQRVRLIVWQRKGITAIFAACFLQIKEHLKRVLCDNVIYADGLTPLQLSNILNRINGENITFAEDDLKKQDRQTDMILIKTEMEIYKRLGLNPGIVDIWESVHHNWKAKGLGYKFDGDASRLTGQATTAIGNAIINLMVKERLVRELGKNLKLMLVLGDDNIMLVDGNITEKQILRQSARHFNMVSEPLISRICGTFLRMIVYKNSNGQLEIGPDIVRLRRKYEVTNGVSESNNINLVMRMLSYCCMIGKTNDTSRLVEKQGFEVKLQQWFEWSSLRNATAAKYKCSESEIDNEYAKLIRTMEKMERYTYKKLMFVSKAH